MKPGILLLHSWSVGAPILLRTSHFPQSQKRVRLVVSAAAVESVNQGELTARERRQLRNARRESKPANNWREEVEERLIKKKKKETKSWKEELNLNHLARLGPQWWVVRVSRVNGHEKAERLARSLARNFPDIDFQVYIPSVQTKRILKNGTLSIKPKALFPGCVFLKCVLNKDIHDFIRECDGIGGFVGSKVGNIKRQINKPRPVDEEDMEAIFKQAKEEQEKADQAFEEEQQGQEAPEAKVSVSPEATVPVSPTKRGRQGRKASEPLGADNKLLVLGSTIQVVSGTFLGFSGILKKLDKKAGLATVGFTLFGKETLADLDVKEIVAEVD
nr:transcription termination/antitermination protein NusG [Ipomoea batatas]